MAADVTGRRSGLFWLGDQPEKIVSGWLDLSGRWPVVELAGRLVPRWELYHVVQPPDGSLVDDGPPTLSAAALRGLAVHGRLHDPPRKVTLIGASEIEGMRMCSGGVKDPGTQQFQGDYALIGGHVEGRDTSFRQVRMRFEHLDVWAHLPGVTLEVNKTTGRAVLTDEQPDEQQVESSEPAGHLILDVVSTFTHPTARGGRLIRSAELRWESAGEGLTMAEVWARLVVPISDLLTLGVGHDSPPVSLEVRVEDGSWWLQDVSPGLTTIGEQVLDVREVLLRRDHLSLEAMARWLARASELSPIPRLVAAAVVSPPGRTLESRLLELASAAEGLHRRLYTNDQHRVLHPHHQVLTRDQTRQARDAVSGVADDEVRERAQQALAHLEEPTYRERLLALDERSWSAIPDGGGDADSQARGAMEWSRLVAKARNGFAHQSTGGGYDHVEDQLKEHVVLLGSLRWMLTALLLIEAGVAPEVVAQRLASHPAYSDYLKEERRWLQSVYGKGNDA